MFTAAGLHRFYYVQAFPEKHSREAAKAAPKERNEVKKKRRKKVGGFRKIQRYNNLIHSDGTCRRKCIVLQTPSVKLNWKANMVIFIHVTGIRLWLVHTDRFSLISSSNEGRTLQSSYGKRCGGPVLVGREGNGRLSRLLEAIGVFN